MPVGNTGSFCGHGELAGIADAFQQTKQNRLKKLIGIRTENPGR